MIFQKIKNTIDRSCLALCKNPKLRNFLIFYYMFIKLHVHLQFTVIIFDKEKQEINCKNKHKKLK